MRPGLGDGRSAPCHGIIPPTAGNDAGMDAEGWVRLGRIILHDRSRYWRTREEFARASGVSARVLDDLEAGRRDNYQDATLAAIEITLGWRAGTCLRVVQGGRVRRDVDLEMSRVLTAWPRLSHDARVMLAELAERSARPLDL